LKKRILALVLAFVMVVSLALPAAMATDHEERELPVAAFSAADLLDFAPFARYLNSLGLFQGVGGGNFALERAPTRAEVLVMLIRLLGMEEAARTGSYGHPFTDARGWFEPYIAFAYEYGLTLGTTATTFAPNATATAQQYVTFVLRALGFDDSAGDFTWGGALQFGMYAGVWDPLFAEGPFLRGHVAAISFLAMAAYMADEDIMLLEVLVDDGVVSASAAAPILKKIANYDLFLSLEYVLARSVVTGGSSTQTTIISDTAGGQYFEETTVYEHTLPTDLVELLEFDIYAFTTLALLSEIRSTESDGKTMLTKTFRDAYFAYLFNAIVAGVVADADGEEVSVVGTPTGYLEARITINAAGNVTAIFLLVEYTVVLDIDGIQVTTYSSWPTKLYVAYQG